MSIQPTPAEPQNLADQRAEDAQYYRRILHELIEIGTDLARRVHQQTKAAPATPVSAPTAESTSDVVAPEIAPDIAPDVAPDVANAFDRIARAVRRTVMLAQKVAEPAAPAVDHAAQRRIAARRRIIREVEDTIQRDAHGAEAESLHADLLDRLDGPDLDDDIANRPVADIIADICRDFGLDLFPGTHPWKRRTAADVTALCARAAMPRAAVSRAPATPVFVRATPRHTQTGRDDPPASAAEASATLFPGATHLPAT